MRSIRRIWPILGQAGSATRVSASSSPERRWSVPLRNMRLTASRNAAIPASETRPQLAAQATDAARSLSLTSRSGAGGSRNAGGRGRFMSEDRHTAGIGSRGNGHPPRSRTSRDASTRRPAGPGVVPDDHADPTEPSSSVRGRQRAPIRETPAPLRCPPSRRSPRPPRSRVRPPSARPRAHGAAHRAASRPSAMRRAAARPAA